MQRSKRRFRELHSALRCNWGTSGFRLSTVSRLKVIELLSSAPCSLERTMSASIRTRLANDGLFHHPKHQPNTMTLRTLAFMLATSASVVTAQPIRWMTYTIPETGTSIDFPSSIFTEQAGRGDGYGLFKAPTAELIANSEHRMKHARSSSSRRPRSW